MSKKTESTTETSNVTEQKTRRPLANNNLGASILRRHYFNNLAANKQPFRSEVLYLRSYGLLGKARIFGQL